MERRSSFCLSLSVRSRYSADPHSSNRPWATPMAALVASVSEGHTSAPLCEAGRAAWGLSCWSLYPGGAVSGRPAPLGPSDPAGFSAPPGLVFWDFHISGRQLLIGFIARRLLQAASPPPLTLRYAPRKLFASLPTPKLVLITFPRGLYTREQ